MEVTHFCTATTIESLLWKCCLCSSFISPNKWKSESNKSRQYVGSGRTISCNLPHNPWSANWCGTWHYHVASENLYSLAWIWKSELWNYLELVVCPISRKPVRIITFLYQNTICDSLLTNSLMFLFDEYLHATTLICSFHSRS